MFGSAPDGPDLTTRHWQEKYPITKKRVLFFFHIRGLNFSQIKIEKCPSSYFTDILDSKFLNQRCMEQISPPVVDKNIQSNNWSEKKLNYLYYRLIFVANKIKKSTSKPLQRHYHSVGRINLGGANLTTIHRQNKKDRRTQAKYVQLFGWKWKTPSKSLCRKFRPQLVQSAPDGAIQTSTHWHLPSNEREKSFNLMNWK